MTSRADSCIFCQIIDGSAPSSEVCRDDDCIAFLDLNPINAGHVLVCPIRHVTSFTELETGEAAAILNAAQRVARSQRASLPGCKGVNLLLSDGEAAGQEVPHTHLHVVPRKEGDGFGWRRVGGSSTREELDSIAAKLRAS